MTKPKPPAKRPARAPSSTRSKTKRAPAKPARRTTAYPAETRATAETLMREESVAAAHDVTGVPKPTLCRWAKAAGIDVGEAARRQTANATEAVRERVARAKLDTVTLLEDHLGEAGSFLSAVVTVNAAAAEAIAGLSDEALVVTVDEDGIPHVSIADEATAKLSRRAHALAGLPLAVRDAEGIVTRAIHDLQLLRGEATERGELVVEFGGIPRPDPRAVKVDQHPEPDDD